MREGALRPCTPSASAPVIQQPAHSVLWPQGDRRFAHKDQPELLPDPVRGLPIVFRGLIRCPPASGQALRRDPHSQKGLLLVQSRRACLTVALSDYEDLGAMLACSRYSFARPPWRRRPAR